MDNNAIQEFHNLWYNGDWSGAADYLSKIRTDNEQDQRIIDDAIYSFRRYGAQYNALLESAGKEGAAAIAFTTAMQNKTGLPGGVDPSKDDYNPYSQAYRNMLSNLGGKDATHIGIKFEGKVEKNYGIFGMDWAAADTEYDSSGYDLFLNAIGMSEEDLKKIKGVQIGKMQDGTTTLHIDKSMDAGTMIKLFQGLNQVNDNYNKDGIIDANNLEPNARYSWRGETLGEDGSYKYSNTDFINDTHEKAAGVDENGNPTFVQDFDKYQERSALYSLPVVGGLLKTLSLSTSERRYADENGYINPSYRGGLTSVASGSDYGYRSNFRTNLSYKDLDKEDFTNVDLGFVTEFVEDVAKRAKDATTISKDEMKTQSQVVYSDFMSAGHADLVQMLAKGQISREDYAFYEKELKNKYLDDLRHIGASQYKIYGTDLDKDDMPEVLTEIDSKGKKDFIDYLSGSLDADKVNIRAAIVGNKTGTLVTVDGTRKEGSDEAKTYRKQFFIENFMNDDCEKLFNRDTKTRALLEVNSMEQYGYRYNLPSRRENLIYDKYKGGFFISDASGRKTQIDKEAAQNYMNEAMILDDGVRRANRLFYDYDGNLRSNVNYKEISTTVEAWMQAAAKELYPNVVNNIQQKTLLGQDTSEDAAYLNNKVVEMQQYILRTIGIQQQPTSVVPSKITL